MHAVPAGCAIDAANPKDLRTVKHSWGRQGMAEHGRAWQSMAGKSLKTIQSKTTSVLGNSQFGMHALKVHAAKESKFQVFPGFEGLRAL